MNTLDFKKLQDEWYRKLAESGFEDAEELIGTIWRLKNDSASYFRYTPVEVREAKIEYFEKIGECVEAESFDSERDMHVLKMWAAGDNIKTIEKKLSEKGYKNKREKIRFIIRKYENRWGIKYYCLSKLMKRRNKNVS